MAGPLLLMACAAPEASTPELAVERFYTMLDALGVRATPDAPALASLRPFIDSALAAVLEARAARVAEATAGHGTDVVANPWASLREGYTAFRVRPASGTGDTIRVAVAFSNEEQRPAVTWVDTVLIVRQQGRYVVSDIRYGAGWDFAARGSLRQALAQ